VRTRAEIDQILVATDFSETADGAVRIAHAYARAFGARLHVFHVTWPDEYGVTALFAALMAQLGQEVPVVAASHGGDPADEIVRYAQSHGIDLIVMGTHGRTGVSRALLGSVAERVTRTASCPVLVVPQVPDSPPPPSAPEAPASEPISTRDAERTCLACAGSTRDLICTQCRARIRGEALERKRREEHG
jgi:nucleotide-binding universal stress UspA family protein